MVQSTDEPPLQVRQEEWQGVHCPLFMNLLEEQKDCIQAPPEIWNPGLHDKQSVAEGPEQVKQERLQLWQVFEERYLPEEHVKQFEGLIEQVRQDWSQGRQLLKDRNVPGLQVIGKHALERRLNPVLQDKQALEVPPLHVKQEGSQNEHDEPFKYLPEMHEEQVVDPEQDRQGEVQRAHTVTLRNSVPRQALHVP